MGTSSVMKRYIRHQRSVLRMTPALALFTLFVACGSATPAPTPTKPVDTTPANHVDTPEALSVAVAVVFNGQEIWVGNEEFESDENAKYNGALHAVAAAFDGHPPSAVFAPGTVGAVISYDTGASVRVPMGPISNLTGNAFGQQKDYRSKIGTDLVQGITLGLNELEKAKVTRRVLVVIGDGNDTNNELALEAFGQIRDRLVRSHTTIHALIYKSAVSADSEIISKLANDVHKVRDADLGAELGAVWTRALEAATH